MPLCVSNKTIEEYKSFFKNRVDSCGNSTVLVVLSKEEANEMVSVLSELQRCRKILREQAQDLQSKKKKIGVSEGVYVVC
jgi:hypothetical protein